MYQSRCRSLVSPYSRSGIRVRHEVYGTARTNEPIMGFGRAGHASDRFPCELEQYAGIVHCISDDRGGSWPNPVHEETGVGIRRFSRVVPEHRGYSSTLSGYLTTSPLGKQKKHMRVAWVTPGGYKGIVCLVYIRILYQVLLLVLLLLRPRYAGT